MNSPSKFSGYRPPSSDFGLDKCVQCGKLVMGSEKESHSAEIHAGAVEYQQLK
jgi:hypothetical protein